MTLEEIKDEFLSLNLKIGTKIKITIDGDLLIGELVSLITVADDTSDIDRIGVIIYDNTKLNKQPTPIDISTIDKITLF